MRKFILFIVILAGLTHYLAERGVASAQAVRTQTCALPFRAIATAVRTQCAEAGAEGNRLEIRSAIDRLTGAGVLDPGELDEVEIAWCALDDATGIAPDAGHIYLHPELRGHPRQTAITLAHEAFHIRQYRAAEPGAFECAYSLAFIACRGCQDRGHPMERAAFEFEDRARRILGR